MNYIKKTNTQQVQFIQEEQAPTVQQSTWERFKEWAWSDDLESMDYIMIMLIPFALIGMYVVFTA